MARYEIRPLRSTERTVRWDRWCVVRNGFDRPLTKTMTRLGAAMVAKRWIRQNRRADRERREVR